MESIKLIDANKSNLDHLDLELILFYVNSCLQLTSKMQLPIHIKEKQDYETC